MILVTGGTGVVGSRVVQALLSNQQQVRVLARGQADWRDSSMPQFRKTGVDVITGDVRDAKRLHAATQGCKAIVHLAAALRGTSDASLESVNAEATAGLVQAAEAQGVQRFIHVSCIGATEHSNCEYFATKWRGESLVRNSRFYWTIFRPSLIFAEDSHLMRILGFWVQRLPVIPVIGSGLNIIRPVSADDVAACIVQSIYNRDTTGKIYELVGPYEYSLTDLLLIASDASGKLKPTVKIPATLGYALSRFIAKLNPSSPIDEDVMKAVTAELSGDPTLMQQHFNVPMLEFENSFKQLPRPAASEESKTKENDEEITEN